MWSDAVLSAKRLESLESLESPMIASLTPKTKSIESISEATEQAASRLRLAIAIALAIIPSRLSVYYSIVLLSFILFWLIIQQCLERLFSAQVLFNTVLTVYTAR